MCAWARSRASIARKRKPIWVRAAAPSVVSAASAADITGSSRHVPMTSTVSTLAAARPAENAAACAVRRDSAPSAYGDSLGAGAAARETTTTHWATSASPVPQPSWSHDSGNAEVSGPSAKAVSVTANAVIPATSHGHPRTTPGVIVTSPRTPATSARSANG